VFLLRLSDERYRALVAPTTLPLINIGAGKDITIRELAQMITEVVGFQGKLVFDALKPDGMPRKLLDSSRLAALGWRSSIPLRTGIERTYELFQHDSAAGRVAA